MIKNTKLTLIILSVIAVVLLVLVLFDVRSVGAKNEETARLLGLAQEASEKDVMVQALRVSRNQAENDIALFENMILTDNTLVPTIEMLEQAARRLGLEVEIASVEKDEPTVDGAPGQVNFLIETKGGWNGTLKFIHAIESLPHKIMIENVYFSKEETDWRASVSLSLNFFN